jgi:hypothetical protein
MSPGNTHVLSVDMARKIKVSHFPAIVSTHSLVFNHAKEITDVGFLSPRSFFTYSSSDAHLSLWGIEVGETNLLSQIQPLTDQQIMSSLGDFKLVSCQNGDICAVGDKEIVRFKVNGETIEEVHRERKEKGETKEEVIAWEEWKEGLLT